MSGVLSHDELAELAGGKIGKTDAPCPLCGPDRKSRINRKRKTLAIWHKPDGFVGYLCARCNASGYAHAKSKNPRATTRDELEEIFARRRRELEAEELERKQRTETARQIWQATVPLAGTLGHKYLTEIRGLEIDRLKLAHCVRWHERRRMIVALMTDPVTDMQTGIHRTFLDVDGNKLERKMLGAQGVIRLTPDDDVTTGLGICEGVEDGLAILLGGWAPVWAATSSGAIERFPVLAGIEHLTIFSDNDDAGSKAARACARRWREAGCEAAIVPAPEASK